MDIYLKKNNNTSQKQVTQNWWQTKILYLTKGNHHQSNWKWNHNKTTQKESN